MRTLFYSLILVLVFSTNVFASPSRTLTKKSVTRASYELIERIIPGYSNQFTIVCMSPSDIGEDRYEVGQRRGKVLLRGNSPVAIATAFNMYLKYTCKAQLSWFGDQLKLPKKLPLPKKNTTNTIQGKYRVYFNYYSISYTASWWNWKRWQREIDFMAMNSINTPLQTIGLDAVWYHTLLKMGFTDHEARGFLVAPAHQAWQWMPNIESVYGLLPKNWIESHKILAKKIYSRQIELGMQPIQQAFTGYVPKLLKKKYPNAHIAQQPEWYGFEGVSQLDPLDPLFEKMGRIFLDTQKELFGSYGLYAADPFHESKPPKEGEDYLHAVGSKIWDLVHDFDGDANVVMQGWSIRKPIVTEFPKDKLIVLDLNGESFAKKNNFWGYPFVTGNLHNFGGRLNLHGDIPLIASNQFLQNKAKAPNVVGSGLFMESVCQNPTYYALLFEMPCHNGSIDAQAWIDNYITRAYGASSESARKAWRLLLKNVYKKGTNGVENSSMICARPAINPKKSGPGNGFNIPYDPKVLLQVEKLLLSDADKLHQSVIYRMDVVDVQRQVMSNLAQAVNHAISDAYNQGDMKTFRKHVAVFLELLLDTDDLLATRNEWNFDQWVTDARSWGKTVEEKNLLERDATSLVTLWGFSPGYECKQFDYSWREWAGLIRRYYYPRWKMFYDMVEEEVSKGNKYTDQSAKQTLGREAFRGNNFYNQLADWEIRFVNTPKKDINPNPKGDEIKMAKKLNTKYAKIATQYY